MRIAVISDIHAAAEPFELALRDAREKGFDQLILLGDVLTYGIEPERCLELTQEAIEGDGAILVGGNHDQLYRDLINGRSHYLDALPDWLRESVYWTLYRIDGCWPVDLTWSECWSHNGAYFAHANPFGYGDWTYLRGDEELARASKAVAAMGFRWGIFGHVHRPACYEHNGVTVHVIGSIGQPRSAHISTPQWALLELDDDALTLEMQPVAFDPSTHSDAIQATASLSQATRDSLCRYFR